MQSRLLAGLILGASIVGVAPATVEAQALGAFQPYVDPQTFRVAPGPFNFLVTEGARLQGSNAVSVGAFANYAYRPVVLYTAMCPQAGNDNGCVNPMQRSVPIQHLATLELLASYTLLNRIQIGLDVPLALEQGDNVDSLDGTVAFANPTQIGAAVGDPRLEVKIRILGEGRTGPGLAVSLFGQLPLAYWTAPNVYFMGDLNPVFGGRLIGEFRTGPFAAAVNVGVLARVQTIELFGDYAASRLLWNAALSYDITPRITALADYFGSTDVNGPFTLQNASEVDLGVRYHDGPIALTIGGGPGIARWVGTPIARGFLGVMYAPYNLDTDHDGIPDDRDRCVNEPEDRDSFQDDDGCPDPDNDGDRILDVSDRCPNDPEDYDQFLDSDGCPDRDNDNDGITDGYDTCDNIPEDHDGDRDDDGCPDNDRDHDGISDERDQCPTQPEDTDGFQDEDGCPDPDNDNDGIVDQQDQCPEQPETYNGYQDDDGCPDVLPDRDHDGIPDGADHCPDQPETYNGFQDEDGCPDRGRSLVRLDAGQIQILQQINFATNSDRIVGAPSFRVLDSVAAVMHAHPELGRVEVQGHTDNVGTADANRALSDRRAVAVRLYLAQHGVEESRLLARGFGPDVPLAPNTNARNRARNRRVEFHIMGPAQHPAASQAPDDDSSAAPASGAPSSAAPAVP